MCSPSVYFHQVNRLYQHMRSEHSIAYVPPEQLPLYEVFPGSSASIGMNDGPNTNLRGSITDAISGGNFIR